LLVALGACRLNSLSTLAGNYPLEFSVSDILVKLYESSRWTR
jgi:hypothetical protein